MANKVGYEWTIEWIADNGDITDSDFADTLKELLQRHHSSIREDKINIGLVRDVWNEFDGVVDRQWAYVIDGGKLPTYFDENLTFTGRGAKVPKKYISEFEKCGKNLWMLRRQIRPWLNNSVETYPPM
tara:strand:- start:363 stop:746 length:384 start_codon:yes stop_codon:yes gene_type:complete